MAAMASATANTNEAEMWAYDKTEGFPDMIQARDGDIELISCEYKNQWMIFISELGRIGTVIEARKDQPRDQTKGGFSIDVKLGDRENLWVRVLARQLVEKTYKLAQKPLLLMCSLVLANEDDENTEESEAKVRRAIALFNKVSEQAKPSAEGSAK
mmetsp:Transcript_7366/g.14659  ORF Transcript_7366/g.14659 Transcript_7366/m.14659 type:complete len:156 (+) Transcript_7366:306-773(+)|eukprot:CAMPEP_0171515658 /NCGR_PEP_ID=MMETSP0959-20130129/3587_1 /TAXON_ID=87120 /ORGANISM="Aurantiochytrium limacinum, Strain ATCCMYA-1381" /LENGTH=155 /DNA_ID=CAMNT_0012054249 /DNA_START=228 /DNA_END=695 /DNA_ORIENTATION=-